jgi:glyoxylase-like metal-dependent hydrolase (beta-lactamase superfamily II)
MALIRMNSDYQHYQHLHRAVLPERYFPHRVMDGIWLWSVYSEEKDIHYNGYLVQTGAHESFLVDPPSGGPDVLDGFEPLPRPQRIILTNADHERASWQFKERFGIPIYIHEKDAALLTHPPDHTFQDGQIVSDNWKALHLPDQKTPGESALYQADRQILIVGDALMGQPFQHLSMQPAEKYADKAAAARGLQRLRDLAVQTVLPGAGDPIMQDAASLIADALIAHLE